MSSPYRAGQTSIFSTFTQTVILTSSCIAVARILALQNYYHAPLDLMFHRQYTTSCRCGRSKRIRASTPTCV
ncbi:hypothetical protein PCASD_17155 [Puccinia coronata f. sp. avenae]|uniref:Uncharacterized protein n=1 Tax=Puccinia coronata f. sp. avenae TaxID=200324 RepID=A0A2N5SHA7_9BASI|nr:hypothetical protein PCASD_17155 [Puccinia coronata f. sp. avenae]